MELKDHNDKQFLLPNSPTSCAIYHAKTESNNANYKLTIADNNGSIRLHGSLETIEDIELATNKLITLEQGIRAFRKHIKQVQKLKLKNK